MGSNTPEAAVFFPTRDRGVLRRAVTTAGLPEDSYNQLESDPHSDRRDGASAVNRKKETGQMPGRNPLEEDELDAPANPVLAAAVARSLYGSAAPYTQVREKAREELDDLIGISQPRLEASTACRQERLSQFSSGVGFAGPSQKDRSSKQKFESIPLAGLSTQRHRNHSSALPTPLFPEVLPSTATTTTSDGASHHVGQSTTTTDPKDSDPLLKQAKVQYV
ncbi:unnamed protein product [Dibothriocephalus latus]|uniref:Uncharacterized protein n=1 Tax=Dibothriocephalus latus TaxID=60516 RepID=A0A3P6TD47_DIBLA|nr:unnamed protein product [Dibothriocephalus latus]